MHRPSHHYRAIGLLLLLFPLLPLSAPAVAQQPGPVRFTEVLNHAVRGSVRLPGTVQSRRSSVVASEVEGLVVDLGVQPGDRVAQGDLLARLRTVTLELQLRAAQGRLNEALARLDLAERNLRRARDLFDEQVVSQGDLDDAVSEQAAWQGRVDETEAEITRIREDIGRCFVRAPYDGVVVAKRAEVGEWIALGGPVVEMMALDDLEVLLAVPERYYALLGPATEVGVTFEALPEMRIEGRVAEIIPRADAQARSFPVKVRIPNPERRIGAGMLAQVDLPIGEPQPTLLVPKDALIRNGSAEFVFRIKEDGTVEQVAVVSGQGVGAWNVVRGPLTAGDRVVTRGNERLFPGQPVAGQPQEYPLP